MVFEYRDLTDKSDNKCFCRNSTQKLMPKGILVLSVTMDSEHVLVHGYGY